VGGVVGFVFFKPGGDGFDQVADGVRMGSSDDFIGVTYSNPQNFFGVGACSFQADL
jgi:hypothetical protein